MSTATPRLSVVMPTHNRPALLREAVDSVLGQTHADWELVIVDDASQPPVVMDVGDPRVRVVRHDVALGGAAAKNTGVAHAWGEFLAFLDDDDCYAPTYAERALAAFSAHPELDVVFMGVSWFGSRAEAGALNYQKAMTAFLEQAGGRVEGSLTLFDEGVVAALLRSVPMALQRPVVRRRAFERIGAYRSDCLLWDCDWAIEAALNAQAALLQEGLYRQRVDGQGYSSRADRTADQLRSGIDIKDRLWARSQAEAAARYALHRDAFRRSASQAWFDLAWHLYGRQQRGPALRALLQSARRHFRARQLLLLLRLLLPRVSRSTAT